MMNRCALIGIIVEDRTEIARLNELLSGYSEYIIGRMGLPHRENGGKEISLISIAMEAPEDKISALSGKIGMISGISAKVIYAKKAEK
ncbi:MAG: iron-only hydrogenase system regulator [Lachnospiraceae bacterium]|nr:iron-only hydrogenase system regulator [Lachnospiraceae bacterium]